MADPYREVVQTLVGLGAERVLVLQGPQPLQPRLLHGFDGQTCWKDQVSLGVLERSFQGEPLLLGDVRNSPLGERWSVQVNNICSLVCVPFWSPSSRILGLLYADTRKAFSRETMAAMQRCARRLEQALYGAPPVPDAAPPPPQPQVVSGRKLGLRAAERPPAPARPAPRRAARPSPSRAVSLRSLATMMAAGLPIERCLQVLAQHDGAYQSVHDRVCQGQPLSQAMAASGAFPVLESALVEVGERSGCLDRVLEQLAETREKMDRAQRHLQSSLTYPLMLCALCLLALVLAPPLVLQGQFELLRQSGQQPPWLTQMVIALSRGPVLLLLAAGLWWLRTRVQPMRLPVVRSLLLQQGAARLARSLAMTYRVGVPITQGLGLAVRASGAPWLEADLSRATSLLVQGEKMSAVVAQFSQLPPSFQALVAAGEECGKLDTTLDWVARFFESEFENRLEAVLSLLQPLLILVMGGLIGLLLLATLLPMVSLVQGL